jgi:hypothetical protein
MNWHRGNHLLRLNSIMLNAYPPWELTDVLKCMYNPRNERRAGSVTFFRNTRNGVRQKLKPQCLWRGRENSIGYQKKLDTELGQKNLSILRKNTTTVDVSIPNLK